MSLVLRHWLPSLALPLHTLFHFCRVDFQETSAYHRPPRYVRPAEGRDRWRQGDCRTSDHGLTQVESKVRNWKFSTLLFVFGLTIFGRNLCALPVHPGGYLTQDALTRVRTNVANGKQPWASAWAALKNSYVETNVGLRLGAATNVTDAYAMQEDGWKAWVLTIKWVASGDIAYANKAESIIDTWVNQVVSMNTDGLRTGRGGDQMANAAEILAYGFNGSAKWPSPNIAKAKAWFKNVPLPRYDTAYSANWGTSALCGVMATAIFCDDQALFNHAVTIYKNGFSPLKDGCAGVTQYIDATGEDAESGRDQGHSQGGIAHLMETALMAWNQGVNLVAYTDTFGIRKYGENGANRIFIGLEYTAKYNLGGTVPYHPFFEYCNDVTIYPNGISATGRGNYSPIWEMSTYLFNKAGLNPVYSSKVVASNGYQPEYTNADHTGLGTLLYSLSPGDAIEPRLDGAKEISSRLVGNALRINVPGSGVAQVKLLSESGKSMVVKQFNRNIELDLGNLKNGVYVMRVNSGIVSNTSKILLVR